MTKNKNRKEDDESLKAAPDIVTKKHGGKVVESIAPEDMISVHDSDCKHESLTRDPTEKQWNAFICDNPNCAIVVIYDKTK